MELVWIWGFLAALLVGFSKTGLPGLGILVVPLMAQVFPARLSVGALLPLLITGDLFGVAYYRRHAQWSHLARLLPFVMVGMGPGWLVLRKIESDQLKWVLGILVLALVALELARQRWSLERLPGQPWFAPLFGALAGFTTTVGNAAGPITNLYMLSVGLPKNQFMGTLAWYFLIVNLVKVPLFVGASIVRGNTLKFDVAALPMVVIGGLVGARLLPKIPQVAFNTAMLALAAAAALCLILL